MLALLLLSTSSAFALLEFKSNLNGSFTSLAEDDLTLQSHNTLALQLDRIYLGAFIAYEKFHADVVDFSTGGMLRYGTSGYVELQLGAFKRELQGFEEKLEGSGFIANIIVGKNISEHISLSLFTTTKRITDGDLEKQWIVDIYPFFGFRMEM